jgi:hypothetical protein
LLLSEGAPVTVKPKEIVQNSYQTALIFGARAKAHYIF